MIDHLRGYEAVHSRNPSEEEKHAWVAEHMDLFDSDRWAWSNAHAEWYLSRPATTLFIQERHPETDSEPDPWVFWSEDRTELPIFEPHVHHEMPMDQATYERLNRSQYETPIRWGTRRGTDYWGYRGDIFTARVDLQPVDVRTFVEAAEVQRERTLTRAQSRVSTTRPASQRNLIPDDVKVFVWQRDQGRCVRCASNEDLEFDHIIPIVMGGSDTARNLQLLCCKCNREKGGNLV